MTQSDDQTSFGYCASGCFGWLKGNVLRTNSHKPTTAGTTSVGAHVPSQTQAAANSDTLLISNNASFPWEDWKIDGGDEFLRKWDAWNRRCSEENQPDSEVQNVLQNIWTTLHCMLDKAKERGQRVLQSDLFKAALDVIPNNVGFPAGALIKVLVQLILLGLKLAGAKQQVYDFTIEVVSDMNRIAGAFGKGTVDERALHQCWEDLEETRKTVNQICAWANKTLDENSRLAISTAITNFEKKLDHARKLFLQLATIRQLRYLADHGQKIDEILGHQAGLQRIERIKATLGSRVVSKALYANWETEQRQYKRSCHPETRDAVLADIDAWIHNPDTTSCLWITGLAGVGKSAIALTTAQCLKDRRAISAKSDSESEAPGVNLVAEYFVSFRDATTSSIESLLPTIAMQLAHASTVAQVIIGDTLKQTPTIAYEFNLKQAQLLFVKPLRAIAEHDPNKLVILIDGIDEFVGNLTHTSQEALHRTVTSTLCDVMSQLPPNVKVLILSRRERGIAAALDTPPVNVRQLSLPTDHSRNDVARFLRSSLKEYAEFPLRRWDGWPDERRFNDLCYLADGHFTCASVAFRWIVSELDHAEDSEVRRNEVFDDLRRAELTGLDELYGFVLAREILDKSGKPIQFRLDVIGCLVILAEPIPNIGVLSALIDAEPRRVLDVIQRTRSLLFDKTKLITEQTVLKPHKSFVDFIISARDKRFPVDVARNHHQLAEGCLRILLDPEKLHFNMARLNRLDNGPAVIHSDEDSETDEDEESTDEESTDEDEESTDWDVTVEPTIGNDVTYACLAFLHHLVNATESSAFFPQLLNFLQNQFLFWLEVLDRHEVSEASAQLQLLLGKMDNVPQTHHQHAQLAHIVDDARNFIQHFDLGHVMYSTRIASIYFSAIPFAPASSLIANHYRARFPSALHSIMPHPHNKWDEIPETVLFGPLPHSAMTDGKRILMLNIETQTQNHTVQCLDAQSGAVLSSTSVTPDEYNENNENDVKIIPPPPPRAFSLDAKFLVLGYHTCRVWNIETGEEEKGVIMKVPTDDSICSLSLPDSSHVVAGCYSGDIRVWNRTLGEIPTSPFHAHAGPVNSIAHSPRGTHIVSISKPPKGDETARVWDISTGVCIFTAPSSWQIAAFSPNGSQIATAYVATIRVWNVLDPSSESPCPPMFKGPSRVTSLTYSPDGRYLVLGHSRCILILDISTGQRIATLTGCSDYVRDLAFFPDGIRLLSMSWMAVHVWDIESLLNGQRDETDNSQLDNAWIVNADRQRLFRPPRDHFEQLMPFRHPRNTLIIGKCLPTPSFSPIAYDEEWKRLGESLMHHARINLQLPA